MSASVNRCSTGDGRDTVATITGGFGNLDTDGYNILGNFEYRKKEAIPFSNRTDRNRVGITDLRSDGFTSGDTTAGGIGAGGTGAILAGRTTTGSSIIGNVARANAITGARLGLYYSRDDLTPATGFTRTFPGASCTQFTSHAQGDPNGSCLTDATQQYSQVIPSSESFNFYTRGSLKINDNLTAYTEGNLVVDRSRSVGTPTGVAGSPSAPGFAFTQNAILGINHPDNPYFGSSAARLRYLAADLGGRTSATDSQFDRFLLGLKGSGFGWDFDTAVSYSRNDLTNTRKGFVQSDVLTALLNPTAANQAAARATSAAYAALPAGTYYRIGENAGLNSSAVYSALAPAISSEGKSTEALIDFKATRELYNLPGGPLGFAIGTEVRHESQSLTPTTGTERANVVGLGYSAYSLTRNVEAAYAEVVAPVIKQVELSAAARYDHYQYAGGAFNPKAGIKITPIDQVAIRGTYTRGFRAPNAAESGGGTAAFSTSTDPVRCAIGFTPACSSGAVAILSVGNPSLKPERSETYTAGFVLDPTRLTTLSADYFVIRRKNEILGGSGTNEANILAGNVTRDPTNTSGLPGDPGAIVSINLPYVNSSSTKVRGLDLDLRQDLPLGTQYGKLSFGLNWTHLFGYQVIDNDGNLSEYAGSHGNCNVTNCIGTPADRVNAALTYTFNDVTVTAVGNFRAAIQNRETKNAPDCETVLGAGDLPANCRVGSFTTVDLTASWKATRNWEIFGSIQNIADRVPPYDPTSYGAVNYNPLDFQGAVGRTFLAGARYKF